MKLKLVTTLAVAGVSLVLVQGACGASMVIAAFYDFKLSAGPENYPSPTNANYFAPGLTGGVTKLNNKSSWDNGGSNDSTLGSLPFADGKFEAPPAKGDGHLRIGLEDFPGNPAPHTAGPAIVRVTNSSGTAYTLDTLYYDAAADIPDQEVQIWYSWTGLDGSFTQLGSSGAPIAKLASGAFDDYGDYEEGLGGMKLSNNSSIFFKFNATSSNTIRLDNIAVYGIPEPGSLLVFGSMAGAALGFRRRQRIA